MYVSLHELKVKGTKTPEYYHNVVHMTCAIFFNIISQMCLCVIQRIEDDLEIMCSLMVSDLCLVKWLQISQFNVTGL